MKKLYLFLPALVVPFALMLVSFYPTGSPGGKTGSPGDGGSTCVECHIGNPVIIQAGWITSDVPPGGYVPGSTYNFTVMGMHENVYKMGFEVTAEKNSDNSKTGNLTFTDTDRIHYTNGQNALTHTEAGNVPSGDGNSWDFMWTAPDEGSGTVTFYAAINASLVQGPPKEFQIYTTMLAVDEQTTGIEDESLAAGIRVYPNPASDHVNVELPKSAELRVVDQAGREVYTAKANSAKERIDISALESGIYFIQVNSEGAVTTERLLKY
jgi:hypothetical protein